MEVYTNKKKKRKYKIIKTAFTILVVGGIIVSVNEFKDTVTIEQLPVNEKYNIEFNQELEEIAAEENIFFQNQELYSILSEYVDGPLTSENIKKIKKVEITAPLTNKDLSDLKYLTNLQLLLITDNEVNLSDLEYNQNLSHVYFVNCTLKNTSKLPNSILTLQLVNSTCVDNRFVVPFYTQELLLNSSSVRNLYLKSYDSLISFSLMGDSFVDLSSIAECTRLSKLELIGCSNITNSDLIANIDSLRVLNIDDYAAIWLNNDTLKKLTKFAETSMLTQEITELDRIAKELLDKTDGTDESKISVLAVYILEKIEYDKSVINNEPNSDELTENYNRYPVYNALYNDKGICINYACLFEALANRMGIDSYQLFSTNHTWNVAKVDDEYKAYDLTNLDTGAIVKKDNNFFLISDVSPEEMIESGQGEELYFYKFDLDEIYEMDESPINEPQDIQDTLINIGYLKTGATIRIVFHGKEFISKVDKPLKILLSLIAIYISGKYFFFKKQDQDDDEQKLTLHHEE